MDRKKIRPLSKICSICNKEFKIPKKYSQKMWNKKHVCSKECHYKYLSKIKTGVKGKDSKIRKKCATCGKDIIIYPNDNKKYNYCSTKCSANNPIKIESVRSLGKSNKGRKMTSEQYERYLSNRKYGKDSPNWKGGVTYHNRKGNYKKYKIKYLKCPEKYKSMSRKDGYVMEHRLLIAKKIGRSLLRSEVVHHIDHNPENNNIENLMLFSSNSEHKIYEGVHIENI